MKRRCRICRPKTNLASFRCGRSRLSHLCRCVFSHSRYSNFSVTGGSNFGSPQFVAEKLIQAEKRKESTKSAEVISVSERLGHDGLQVYEFEYKVDSTRGGMKRVFSAVFASSKKLYLLNISYTDGLEIPLDLDKRMVLEKVLHSFDVAPST